MAFSSLAAFRAAQLAPHQQLDVVKDFSTPAGLHWDSTWTRTGMPAAGSTPGASAVCDRATVGALGQVNKSAGTLYTWLRKFHNGGGNSAHGKIMLADRLVHMGGLDATNTGAQSVSSSALTRFTGGDGVFAAIEIYTGIGATPTTLTASYTNQAGTPGRTSQPIAIGGTGLQNLGTLLPLSLQAGDTGVRAVSTVTLAGTTGTAGNFGVTLYKPLLTIPMFAGVPFGLDGDPIKTLGGFLAQVPDNACLWLLMFLASAQSNTPMAEVLFAES
jgi:hypothetical protein